MTPPCPTSSVTQRGREPEAEWEGHPGPRPACSAPSADSGRLGGGSVCLAYGTGVRRRAWRYRRCFLTANADDDVLQGVGQDRVDDVAAIEPAAVCLDAELHGQQGVQA